MLLAPTFEEELRPRQAAEVTTRFLASQARKQSAQRSKKSARAQENGMERVGYLGMSDEGTGVAYEAGPGVSRELKSVELFTGAGGLALGLENAGFKSSLMVEWDKDACETIKKNAEAGGVTCGWPLQPGDVRDVSFAGLGEVDLVAGGPPCQPFSIAGKHRGLSDPRDMWPQAIRAVREINPKAFLFENVRGLARASFASYLRYIVERLKWPEITARQGESWEDHLSRLLRMSAKNDDNATYRVAVHKVNAADYGAAQKRHRIVIVGYRSDLNLDWQFPSATHSSDALWRAQNMTGEYWTRHGVQRLHDAEREQRSAIALTQAEQLIPWVTVRDAIAGLPEPYINGKGCSFSNHRFQDGARVYTGHTGSPLDAPAKALKAGDHGVPGGENMLVRQDGSVRYFTVRESARLQGFPDSFVFPGSWTESMRQLGNAVPVPMAATIAGSLSGALNRLNASVKVRRAA